MYAKYALAWYLCKTVFIDPGLVTIDTNARTISLFHSDPVMIIGTRVMYVPGNYRRGHLDCQVLRAPQYLNLALPWSDTCVEQDRSKELFDLIRQDSKLMTSQWHF